MSVLLQISDPHFGTEQPHVVEALVAMAQSVRPDAGPDLLFEAMAGVELAAA